jgi:hypothetical protein
MAYGSDLTKTSAICDCGFEILQNVFVQRQFMFAVSPMINSTSRNADFSDAPCETKLFFFGASITVDYDGCTPGYWGLQYDARDCEPITLNNRSF